MKEDGFCVRRAFSMAVWAAPIAPISPGYGARTTSRPIYCSMAHRTASLQNVPPCTTILSPRESRLLMRMTFVKTFSIMDRQSPARISLTSLPFFCSVMMRLFIKTVQRLPSTAGCFALKARSAISGTGTPMFFAKFSRKDPQPAEQASFTTISVMIPSSSQMAFMSCPPISRIKVASSRYLALALA